MGSRSLTPRQRFLVRGTLVVLAGLGIVAGFVVLGVYPPTGMSFYPKCLLFQTTGLHCTGCGLTRAAHAALNGRMTEAVSQNALVFVVVPWLLAIFLRRLWRYLWQAPTPPVRRWPKWLTYTLIGLLFAFTVARNIPVYPLTLLAPHELAQRTPEEPSPADPPPG